MPRRKPEKYNRKFCKQLVRGLRLDGKSIAKCCSIWGVTEWTYYDWKKKYPEFAAACEFGDRDYKCYWEEILKNAAEGKTKVSGPLLALIARNIYGWTNISSDESNTKSITNIVVEVAEPRESVVALLERLNVSNPNDTKNNIIDAEPN